MSLSSIKNTVQNAASAITSAIDLETEIVDENLQIIGGTGRYFEKIGQYEEAGKLDSDLVYASCLRNGVEYTNFSPRQDPNYDAKEGEKAEICCPIKVDNNTIGLIGLIAFSDSQRDIMMGKTAEFTTFLRIMSELIAGKYTAEMNNLQLKDTISSLLPSDESTSFDSIIGESPSMLKLKKRALQISQSDSTVLITGESGTGKDLFARAIHNESFRKKNSFISINCAAIPEMLLESELFGYEGGAFTGAKKSGKAGKFKVADGGTIFLDEIGDMPLHLQAKLLATLQNRQIDPIGSTKPIDIDVRLIAATNKDLEEMISQKQFREDLYFRLNVIPLHIPPLRERPEDIALLLDHSIEKFSNKLGKPVYFIDQNAKATLLAYDWPGNVRETENIIEYAVNMSSTNSITLQNLPESVCKSKKILSTDGHETLRSRLSFTEKQIITSYLDKYGWSLEGKRKAAEKLGISESTLYRRLRSLSFKCF